MSTQASERISRTPRVETGAIIGANSEGSYGTITLAEGLEVCSYLSPEDGALVVQIDTPADGVHEDQKDCVRVYINDFRCNG